MTLQRRRNPSLCYAALFTTLAVFVCGCDRSQQGANNTAAGRVADGGKPGETPVKKPASRVDHPAVDERPDSLTHPAVSTNAVVTDSGKNGDPPAADAPTSDVPQHAVASDSPPDSPAADGKPTAIPAPPPGALPQIALSSGHKATCKLFVGDTLPPVSLIDLDGNPAPLDKHFGERLTLVMFWQHHDADAVEALGDIGPLTLTPYSSRGVKAIAIHVGPATDEVKSLAQQFRAAFPLLVDADGAALAQVAAEPQGLMPRIFLVDATGRILWFDIEYSRTTRRDLDAALRYLTRQ